MKFGRIVDWRAVDVRSTSPEGYFTPQIAAEFQELPDEVEEGWEFREGTWQAPIPPEVLPPPPEVLSAPLIGPIAFQLLFTIEELIALETAKVADPVVRIFWKLLDDPRTDVVDRNLPSVKGAINHLNTVGVLSAERLPVILGIG